ARRGRRQHGVPGERRPMHRHHRPAWGPVHDRGWGTLSAELRHMQPGRDLIFTARGRALVFFLVLGFPAAGAARAVPAGAPAVAEVRLELRPPAGARGAQGTVELAPEANGGAVAASPRRSLPIGAGWTAVAALPVGSRWRVAARVAGLWAAEEPLEVGSPA